MGNGSSRLATLPSRITKRDGQQVAFDASKIESAILRAGQDTGEFGALEASLLTAQVVKVLAHRYDNGQVPDIEGIQDVVEQTLITANHFETARSYIVYREQRAKLRADRRTLVDVASSINEYLDRSDWRVAANANQGYSLGGLILNTSGKMIANYWLSHVYPPAVGEAHRNGDIHIHDLDMLAGYCAGWSLRTLLAEGLNGVPGKVEAGPPRHMSSAIGQIVNFLGTLQNEWAGAQAFSSFDTYMAPYVRLDQLSYRQVKQYIQELIYNLNVPSRWGCQCVDEQTECLTEHGWKRYDQIADGERIATFDWRNNCLEYLEPLAMTAYDFDGDMYVLRNRTQEQWVTPRHKIVRKVFNSDGRWILEDIEDVAKLKSPVIVPNAWQTASTHEVDDRLVMLLAWVVAEGNFDFSAGRRRVSLYQSIGNRENAVEIEWLLHELSLDYHIHQQTGTDANHPVCRYRLNRDASEFVLGYLERKCVPDLIRTLSARQIRLFLETYVKGDGSIEASGRVRIYTNDRENLDALQELCALAGWGSTVYTRKDSGVHVLNIIRNHETYIQLIERKPYKGKVWCPTTRNGTFVARRNGKTFVTGNTPFTNLTFDWVCPEDLREQVPVIGGEEQSFTYGEVQAEMDMINRAYIEVMTEGDAKGRIFTFPIPTYNITDEFPWDDENAELLFSMTAKYGLPYFCLAEGTRVYTRDGIKAVEALSTDDEVVGSDGTYKRIKGVAHTCRDAEVTVTTVAGRSVRCSDNHRFPTADGLKAAAALSLGDALLVDDCTLELETGLRLDRRSERLFRLYDEQDRSFTLAELDTAPAYCRIEPRPRQVQALAPFSFQRTRFQTTLSNGVRLPEDLDADLCELLGQLLGDGSLRRGRISLANADTEVLDFFADVLQRKFNLEPSVSQCGVSLTCKTSAVASVMLTDWLEHVGLELTTCWNKQVPEILYRRSDAEIGALLRGLFDTDGSVSTRNATSVISLASTSPRLLQQVLELLAMLSIVGRYNERIGSVVITGERNVRLFAERVGFRVARKLELVRHAESQGKTACGCRIIARADASDGTFGHHYRYRKDAYFRVRDADDGRLWLFCGALRKGRMQDPIAKIEGTARPTRMVDIEIDSDDHLFLLANDLLTHNSNFVSSDMEPNMVRSMCCRLRLDVSELLKRGNGLFGSAEQTGSLGVVTINCARLGYTHAGDEAGLLKRLDELMELARKSLELKRKVIQRHMDAGLFPYTKRYLGTLRNHFSTIGVNGINEMIRNFTHDAEDITTEWGHAFAARLLDHVRERMVQFQEETGHMYNLEATPAEGTTYRFAREDKKRYPGIVQAGTEQAPYYTNSSQLPVGYTDDAFEALAMQQDLQSKYTGGTVLHLYMGEQFSSTDACKRLVRRALTNFRLPYITVTPVFSICPNHGYIAGEHEFCPKCDDEIIERKRGAQSPALAET